MKPQRTAAVTRQIGDHLRRLRRERGLSQIELAGQLGLSQSRLSGIERGRQSLTAEEFLDVLKLFNVPATDFVSAARASDSQIQNALERLGAIHLRENPAVLPSEVVKEAGDVIREVLIAVESPRHITALAPVLILHADQLNLQKLRSQLNEVGLQRRLGWLLENTLEAAKRELNEPTISKRWSATYRRAIVVLSKVSTQSDRRGGENAVQSGAARQLRPTRPWRVKATDIIDRHVRSEATVQRLADAGSPISRRWNIVTAIQVDDFVGALRASREQRNAIMVKQPGVTNPQWTLLPIELQRNFDARARHETKEQARTEIHRLHKLGVTEQLGIADLTHGLGGPVEPVER